MQKTHHQKTLCLSLFVFFKLWLCLIPSTYLCSSLVTKGILEDSWSLLIAPQFRVGESKSVMWVSVTSLFRHIISRSVSTEHMFCFSGSFCIVLMTKQFFLICYSYMLKHFDQNRTTWARKEGWWLNGGETPDLKVLIAVVTFIMSTLITISSSELHELTCIEPWSNLGGRCALEVKSWMWPTCLCEWKIWTETGLQNADTAWLLLRDSIASSIYNFRRSHCSTLKTVSW